MKPTLQFRLSQHLTLTPQLQQSIRLLQLSTVELNQEIERLLMENPILEREDGETDAAGRGRQPAGSRACGARGNRGRARPRRERGDEREADRQADLPTDYAAPWRGTDDGGSGSDDDGDRAQTAADLPTLRDHLNSELALTQSGRAATAPWSRC